MNNSITIETSNGREWSIFKSRDEWCVVHIHHDTQGSHGKYKSKSLSDCIDHLKRHMVEPTRCTITLSPIDIVMDWDTVVMLFGGKVIDEHGAE